MCQFQTRSEVHCPHELRRNVLATAREAAGVRAGAQAVFVSVEQIGADVVVDVRAVGADIHRFFGITDGHKDPVFPLGISSTDGRLAHAISKKIRGDRCCVVPADHVAVDLAIVDDDVLTSIRAKHVQVSSSSVASGASDGAQDAVQLAAELRQLLFQPHELCQLASIHRCRRLSCHQIPRFALQRLRLRHVFSDSFLILHSSVECASTS